MYRITTGERMMPQIVFKILMIFTGITGITGITYWYVGHTATTTRTADADDTRPRHAEKPDVSLDSDKDNTRYIRDDYVTVQTPTTEPEHT